MNPETPSPAVVRSERRLLRWLLIGLALLITPVIVVALGVVSMLRLNREAAILKHEVMAATEAGWDTKVQISAGWGTLTAARAILRFVEHEQKDEARLALSAVRHASVGVYEQTEQGTWSREQLIRTDTRMRDRGWIRLVGVTEEGQAVLVYGKEAGWSGGTLDLCLAVVDGRELVVVATRVDPDPLAELVGKHLPETGFREKLKLSKL